MKFYYHLPKILLLLFLLAIGIGTTRQDLNEAWGFYGHKRINRMAVFTLPPEMIGFYKKHIEYITDHAVDPDKRRYATKHEAVRHYIDIDHWGEFPYDMVPRDFTDALVRYTDFYVISEEKDTMHLFGDKVVEITPNYIRMKKDGVKAFLGRDSFDFPYDEYRAFFKKNIQANYYEDDWKVDGEVINKFFKKYKPKVKAKKAFAIDRFSPYGICPYNLPVVQKRLTDAFIEEDKNKILRLSAEIGHYIGDAHVPLHTTENYNGQLTNQVGIHGFWESRLPELFADKEYNFFVGKAEYIENPNDYYWDVVMESHSHLDSVLLIEKRLSETIPRDKQYCYEKRLEATVLTQCKTYARAYHEAMKGMVESRMQASIRSIGSAWFTAWVNAGQPDLKKLKNEELDKAERERLKNEESLFKAGKIKGRSHGN